MKNNKFIKIIAVFLMLFLFSQCYYDSLLPELTEPVVGEVSFQGDIISIFNESCNYSGCHNQGGITPDLSVSNAYNSLINGNYIDTAVPEDSELYQWMTDNRSLSMPLDGPNAGYNALVLKWIQQGAINN
jgi:hypothetical protein